jgi:hypothetical protein
MCKKMNIKPGIQLLEEVEGAGEEAKSGDIVEVRLNGCNRPVNPSSLARLSR